MARMAYAAHSLVFAKSFLPVPVWDDATEEERAPYYAFAEERLTARQAAASEVVKA